MLGSVRSLCQTLVQVARDAVALISSAMRSRARLAAENLSLRKQLALYIERQVKPFLDRKPSLILPMRLDRSKVFLGQFNYTAVARLKPGATIAQVTSRPDCSRLLFLLVILAYKRRRIVQV